MAPSTTVISSSAAAAAAVIAVEQQLSDAGLQSVRRVVEELRTVGQSRLWYQFGQVALGMQRHVGQLQATEQQKLIGIPLFATIVEMLMLPAVREINPVTSALLASSAATELATAGATTTTTTTTMGGDGGGDGVAMVSDVPPRSAVDDGTGVGVGVGVSGAGAAVQEDEEDDEEDDDDTGVKAAEALLWKFIESYRETTYSDPLGGQAIACLLACAARFKIGAREKETADSLLSQAKLLLDQSKVIVQRSVYAVFYEAVMAYRRAHGPAELFYEAAMSFFRIVPLTMLSQEEAVAHAKTVILSVLYAESFFDFNDLLGVDLMRILKGTKVSFLGDIVQACAEGDSAAVDAILLANQEVIEQDEELEGLSALETLHDKLPLIKLMNIVVRRELPCVMSYADVVDAIGIDQREVEILLFYAVSQGLFQVRIDQVSERVKFLGTRPVRLGVDDVTVLVDKLDEWVTAVNTLSTE